MGFAMNISDAALQVISRTVSNPMVMIAVLVTGVTWAAISYRLNRNATLIANIEKLPSDDRRATLEAEMGVATVQGGISPQDWLQQKRQFYYFLGFAGMLLALVVLTVVAVSEAKAFRSREELGRILSDRGMAFMMAIGDLIDDPIEMLPPAIDRGGQRYKNELIAELSAIKYDAERLIEKQQQALTDAEMVRFYELGNELNSLGLRIELLIGKSSRRAEELIRMSRYFSGATRAKTTQTKKLSDLKTKICEMDVQGCSSR